MPAFGLLVIVLGIWVLVNTINGNLLDVVEGKAKFNFSSSPPPSNSSAPPTTSGTGSSG